MKQNLTDISVVLDRSISMQTITEQTIAGFNAFLKSQREAVGEATLTLAQFDTQYDVIHSGVNVKHVPDLNMTTYVPRGYTALLDAIGFTIVNTGIRLAAMKEEDRPENVIFVIQTDGQENSSKEYTYQMVKDLIEQQTKTYNWDFVFLGANQDAIVTGSHLGIGMGNSMTFEANAAGSLYAYDSISNNMTMYRGLSGDAKMMKKSAFFTSADRTTQANVGA